jgi:UDP-N-acetylmuramate: L-alanyl-gamma-D-glutamyl-meso-diaminopimelate ligase
LSSSIGISPHSISEALKSFKSPRRRLEKTFESKGILLIDDFAHHPTAVSEGLKALRAAYPQSRIVVVFEPRSWSCRKNVHQQAFPAAFSLADITIVADVYGKEKLPPDERLNPEKIVGKLVSMGREAYFLPDVEAILTFLRKTLTSGDVVCTMSNASFDDIQERLKDLLISMI